MKYFITTDIHAHYFELMDALTIKGFDINNCEHILVSLGDMYDRGEDVIKLTYFFMKLYKQNRLILIKGNHEDMLFDCIKNKTYNFTDIENGTYKTLQMLVSYVMDKEVSKTDFKENFEIYMRVIENDTQLMEMLNSSLDYYELDNYILVHGYIPVDYNNEIPEFMPDWRNASEQDWHDARFYNGIELSCEYYIKPFAKTIVVGHEFVGYGNVRKKYGFDIDQSEALKHIDIKDRYYTDIFYDDKIIALDSNVYQTRILNMLVIEE